MKKFLLVSFLLICLFCVGCRIQFGPHILYATYYDSPAEAYLAEPYENVVSHTYLYMISEELACIPISDDKVYWVARVEGNRIIEVSMQVNDKNKYCTAGTYSVAELKMESNMEEIYLPQASFVYSDQKTLYSGLYTVKEYEWIKNQLKEGYTVLSFDVELDGENCTFYYVYIVK